MKLSVIITNYNKMPLINYLIGYFNYHISEDVEVFIIDDNSSIPPDNTGIIKLVVNSENLGIGRVRQQGIDISSGDYIVFIDGDDIITEDYLETILTAIQSNLDIYEFSAISYPEYNSEFFNGMPSHGLVWNKVYKRDFIKKNNLIFGSERCEEDLAFNESFFLNNPSVGYIDKVLYIYNNLTAGITSPGYLRQVNLFD